MKRNADQIENYQKEVQGLKVSSKESHESVSNTQAMLFESLKLTITYSKPLQRAFRGKPTILLVCILNLLK